MKMRDGGRSLAWALVALAVGATGAVGQEPRAKVDREGDLATIAWPCAAGESGRLTLDLRPGQPLFRRVEIVDDASGKATILAAGVEPAAFLVVGSRENPPPTPAGMSVFNVFFDNPLRRPHRAHATGPIGREFRKLAEGARASVAVGPVSAGPFRGEVVVTVYAGARLIHVETVLTTAEDRRAFTYDAGLVADAPIGERIAWVDTEGKARRVEAGREADTPEAVRYRAIVAESTGGSLACFPPPHQFLLPARLHRQPQHDLARGRPSRPLARQGRLRHPPAGDRRGGTTSPGSTPRRGPSSASASSTS